MVPFGVMVLNFQVTLHGLLSGALDDMHDIV